jgi:tRNA pseudouridine13 synthase
VEPAVSARPDAVTGVLAPEDFRVDEVPLYAPAGEGGHTFVLVEKRLRTTDDVARALARACGVRARDVGYAGRKDRRAVTTQWFSVPGLAPDCALALSLPGVRVLDAARHPHKLRTGHLRGNRFRIAVRGGDVAAAQDALARLERVGMPNRFGDQRFGRGGANPERAHALLAGGPAPGDRRQARFLLSALQAAVFNDVLAARAPRWDRVERGDVAVVHASGGLFRVDDPEAEAARAAAFEISATGPIFGTRVLAPGGDVAECERAVLARHGIDPDNPRVPRGIRLRGARRSLRVRPQAASVGSTADGLELCFTLPAGSYATVLLEEVLGAPARRRPPDDIASRVGVS